MKLSQFIAKLTADLEANGDTENVLIGVAVAGDDGKHYRLDAVLTEDGADVLRDVNYTDGMACIVGHYHGNHQLRAQLGVEKVSQKIEPRCENCDYDAQGCTGPEMCVRMPSEVPYNGPVEVFTGYVLHPGGRIQVDFQAPLGATEAEKAMKFFWALGEQADIGYLAIGDSDHPLPEFEGDSHTKSTCDNCGAEVESIVGCTDGAEVCQQCFDAGDH